MGNYYAESLNASRLLDVYRTEIPRVKQYLKAEVDFVKNNLHGNESVLELGAGYGRIMKELSPSVHSIIGMEISQDSVRYGRDYLKDCPNCRLISQDVHALDADGQFDVVLCLQNGLSAFKGVDTEVARKAARALKKGGTAYFSSYSMKFWDTRLAWFQEQAAKGLLGEIDFEKTGEGEIVCRDGFTATTHTPQDMERLGRSIGQPYRIQEVDESSVFLIINKQ